MEEEASMFGLHVSWSKTKTQNLCCGPAPCPVIVNCNIIDPVQEFTHLGSIQLSNSNSSSESIRRIGLHVDVGVMKSLDRVWNEMKTADQLKFLYILHMCWRYSSTARKPGPLHNLTGGDWIYSIHDVNDGFFTLMVRLRVK